VTAALATRAEIGAILLSMAELWEHAKQGHGKAIWISGEAGIGKSRLVQELRMHVEKEGNTRLTCQVWPHFRDSALRPLILLARLDRLPSTGMEVARIGAVIGRTFSYAMIRAWRMGSNGPGRASYWDAAPVVLPGRTAMLALLADPPTRIRRSLPPQGRPMMVQRLVALAAVHA
jgi:hypothetical protein